MVKRIAIALVALVGLLVLVGLALPRRWRVEQSITIDAPPERIHPFLNDLRRWQEWAVWTRAMDPQVRNTYGGAQDGVGATWAWLGPTMGRGRMEIVASDAREGLTIDEAIEADEVNARTTFTFSPVGGATRVTWVDEGTLPPVMGGYFRGMIERMLAEHFGQGLQRLKQLVEAQPPPVARPPPPPPALAVDAGAPDAG